MKATKTQTEIAARLHELLTSNHGCISVPLHLANTIKATAAAIGLCVCSGARDNNETIIYIA